ncbi:glycosyltransferase [Parablautia intestinalis]|uniref:Glycosyltransferase n=1 Tax=Parablautia intestinalis TaxID=2320100 RepID=A0A3A9ABP0_9FIRM|nr:glycosyltransferase family 4 protein [Parablautia intestinalis]RKI88668.1 glycosyltransferase [Parablautia intestinalis]
MDRNLLQKDKKILLISYSLSMTGAPIALLNMAIALKNFGYSPVILSNTDGDLRNVILDNNIAVVIEPQLETNVSSFAWWVKKYDYVVINTILYSNSIKYLKENRKEKIIWWIHESSEYYKNININLILSNIVVCGVGKIASDNFYRAFNVQPYNLLYGVRNECLVQKKRYDDRIVFALIGKIGYRKGTDVFLDALEILPSHYRDNICFLVIGSKEEGNDEVYARLLRMASFRPEIQVVGEFDRERLYGAFSGIDMLLLPSKEDPMPVVFAEAAINQIPSIISTGCGTVEYLKNGVNSYIFEKNDFKQLAEKIIYAYEHRNNIKEMGKEVKVLFDKFFSMNVFESSLRKLLREVLWEE